MSYINNSPDEHWLYLNEEIASSLHLFSIIDKEFNGSPKLHDNISINSVVSSVGSKYNGQYESTLERNRNSEFHRYDQVTGQLITYPPEEFGPSDMGDSDSIVDPRLFNQLYISSDDSLPLQNENGQNDFIEPREGDRQNEMLNLASPIKSFMRHGNFNRAALNERSNTANQPTTQSQSNYLPRQDLKKSSWFRPGQQISGISVDPNMRQDSEKKQQKCNSSTCLHINCWKPSTDDVPIRNTTGTKQGHFTHVQRQEKHQKKKEEPRNFNDELELQDHKFRELRKYQLQELQTQQQQLQMKLDQQIKLQQQEEEQWKRGREELRLQALSGRLEQADDKDADMPDARTPSTEIDGLNKSPGPSPGQSGHKNKLSKTGNGSTSKDSPSRGFTQKLLPKRFFKRRNSAVPVLNPNSNTSTEHPEQKPTSSDSSGSGKLGPLKRGMFSGSNTNKTGKRGEHRSTASEGDALMIAHKDKHAKTAPSHPSASKSLGTEQDLYDQFPTQYQSIMARPKTFRHHQSNKSSNSSKRHHKRQASKSGSADSGVSKVVDITPSVTSDSKDIDKQPEVLGGVRRVSFLRANPRKSLIQKHRASSDNSASSSSSRSNSPHTNTKKLGNSKSPPRPSFIELSSQQPPSATAQKHANTAASSTNKNKISPLSGTASGAAAGDNMYTRLFQDEPTLDPRVLARMRDPGCTIPGTWLEEWAAALARDISRFRDMKQVYEQMYGVQPLVPTTRTANAAVAAASYE